MIKKLHNKHFPIDYSFLEGKSINLDNLDKNVIIMVYSNYGIRYNCHYQNKKGNNGISFYQYVKSGNSLKYVSTCIY